MNKKRLLLIAVSIICIFGVAFGVYFLVRPDDKGENEGDRNNTSEAQIEVQDFSFVVTADMRQFSGPDYDTPNYFRGAAESISQVDDVEFMIIPGDLDPPEDVSWTIDKYIGEDFAWYPVVGNHEVETVSDMVWLRDYEYDAYGGVNQGPTPCAETTYSFDFENSHFIILNLYCDVGGDDVTSGKVSDVLYDWLAEDLADTSKETIFVTGHEPAYPQPDADSGRERHFGDSLDQHPESRDKFWGLLGEYGVDAYFCGHTHNYSAVEIEGVWQIDAGHVRGAGDAGAKSTYIVVKVAGDSVSIETYRADASGENYTLFESVELD